MLAITGDIVKILSMTSPAYTPDEFPTDPLRGNLKDELDQLVPTESVPYVSDDEPGDLEFSQEAKEWLRLVFGVTRKDPTTVSDDEVNRLDRTTIDRVIDALPKFFQVVAPAAAVPETSLSQFKDFLKGDTDETIRTRYGVPSGYRIRNERHAFVRRLRDPKLPDATKGRLNIVRQVALNSILTEATGEEASEPVPQTSEQTPETKLLGAAELLGQIADRFEEMGKLGPRSKQNFLDHFLGADKPLNPRQNENIRPAVANFARLVGYEKSARFGPATTSETRTAIDFLQSIVGNGAKVPPGRTERIQKLSETWVKNMHDIIALTPDLGATALAKYIEEQTARDTERLGQALRWVFDPQKKP